MSVKRRLRRAQEREAQAHFDVLANLLMGFYEFLERTPKPSDEAVRMRFVIDERRWKNYCSQNHLNEEASLLFNKEVSISWEKRYKEQPKNESIKN